MNVSFGDGGRFVGLDGLEGVTRWKRNRRKENLDHGGVGVGAYGALLVEDWQKSSQWGRLKCANLNCCPSL
jgi:hypothetical protein